MEVEETTKVGEETRKDQTRVVQKVEVEVPLHHCHLNEYFFYTDIKKQHTIHVLNLSWPVKVGTRSYNFGRTF